MCKEEGLETLWVGAEKRGKTKNSSSSERERWEGHIGRGRGRCGACSLDVHGPAAFRSLVQAIEGN